jgi:hypothetical protein
VAGWWFSLFTPPIKPTAMIDISEILLKVALNTTISPPPFFKRQMNNQQLKPTCIYNMNNFLNI